MLDYYRLRDELKTCLLRKSQAIDVAVDALLRVWIIRAFAAEGIQNNPLLDQGITEVGVNPKNETVS